MEYLSPSYPLAQDLGHFGIERRRASITLLARRAAEKNTAVRRRRMRGSNRSDLAIETLQKGAPDDRKLEKNERRFLVDAFPDLPRCDPICLLADSQRLVSCLADGFRR